MNQCVTVSIKFKIMQSNIIHSLWIHIYSKNIRVCMGMIKKNKIRLVVASKYAKSITGDRYRMGFRYIYTPFPAL